MVKQDKAGVKFWNGSCAVLCGGFL